ncbi:MAG: O-antigen ligase family protein [Pirellulales bacterium]
MAWTAFILLTATLFIRPSELIPEVEGWQIYELLIIGCLVLSWPLIIEQLSPAKLAERPISACVVGLLPAVVLSHLAHFFLWGARVSGQEFGKVVLYYLLVVSLVDTPARLQSLLRWLVLFIVVSVSLVLLEYHGWVDIAAIDAHPQKQVDVETGEVTTIPRIRSTGIFRDPNDLSMILLVGMVLCVYGAGGGLGWLPRPVWLAPLALCGYALVLTRSRGGFVALIAAALSLCVSRFGWRRSLPLIVLGVPLIVAIFAGRMTDLSTSEGTGQSRIQLWSMGLALLKQFPVFGSGYATYVSHAGQVAHNSFVHCFAELGIVGGGLFLGAFGIALWELRRLGSPSLEIADPDLRRMRPYLLAMLVTYAASMLSLSRAYIAPTYLILGLATAYLGMMSAEPRPEPLRFDRRLLSRLALASVAFLACTYVFIRLFARWG